MSEPRWSDELEKIRPVFFKASDLMRTTQGPPKTVEICEAAETASGRGSILGCQKISGIFRLLPKSAAARVSLIGGGFTLRGQRVMPLPSNPGRVFYHNGVQVEAVRLTISNIPFSVSNGDISLAISTAGYCLVSDLTLEQARDSSGFLTRFLNGNRSVFAAKPTSRTPKTVKVNNFLGYIYYPEREDIEKDFPLFVPSQKSVETPLDIESNFDTSFQSQESDTENDLENDDLGSSHNTVTQEEESAVSELDLIDTQGESTLLPPPSCVVEGEKTQEESGLDTVSIFGDSIAHQGFSSSQTSVSSGGQLSLSPQIPPSGTVKQTGPRSRSPSPIPPSGTVRKNSIRGRSGSKISVAPSSPSLTPNRVRSNSQKRKPDAHADLNPNKKHSADSVHN